ncbi:hypothetical protein SO802_001283 [Lithocarpus litseifolius]|uniref:Endonuclease/exonuclease/phosphatase domain-containing protein n=1 Tax=Lithocarpus litseifolius TaxID=425828 RepID=A0AAW2DXQ4_9ROSI
MVRAKDPSVVFLAETWADEARLKDVKRKIQFEHMFVSPRNNRGGGLVLFWRESVDISVEGCDKNHIDTIINKNKENEWRFTGFYGEPDTQKRVESWNLLRDLNQKFRLPWLCAGDFNELVRSNEKLGGNRRSNNQMQLFRDAIDACGFIDLGYWGSKFTWSKHYRNGFSIWERLDRALCTPEWLTKFAGTKVTHLTCTTSDHSPLWITPSDIPPPPLSRPFRFEEMWLSDKGCGRVIEAVWRNTSSYEAEDHVLKKIEKCGTELTQWSRRNFGHVRKNIVEKRKCLARAEVAARQSGCNLRVRELKLEINELLIKENTMWRQRAKSFWLVGGDMNSKYFHSRATQRYRRNRILGIQNPLGDWVTQPNDIAETFIESYQQLFASSNPRMEEAALIHMEKSITDEMNAMLMQEFTEVEVEAALK